MLSGLTPASLVFYNHCPGVNQGTSHTWHWGGMQHGPVLAVRRKLINDLIPQFQTRCFSPSLTSSHFPAALFPPECVIIHYMYFLHYSLFPFECVINIPDSRNLRQRKTRSKGPKINKHSRYSPVDCNSCGQGLIVRDLYMSVYQGLLSQNVECPLCTWSHCFNIVSLPC